MLVVHSILSKKGLFECSGFPECFNFVVKEVKCNRLKCLPNWFAVLLLWKEIFQKEHCKKPLKAKIRMSYSRAWTRFDEPWHKTQEKSKNYQKWLLNESPWKSQERQLHDFSIWDFQLTAPLLHISKEREHHNVCVRVLCMYVPPNFLFFFIIWRYIAWKFRRCATSILLVRMLHIEQYKTFADSHLCT